MNALAWSVIIYETAPYILIASFLALCMILLRLKNK